MAQVADKPAAVDFDIVQVANLDRSEVSSEGGVSLWLWLSSVSI